MRKIGVSLAAAVVILVSCLGGMPAMAAIVLDSDWAADENWADKVSLGTPGTVLTDPDSGSLKIVGGDAGGDSESYIYNNTTLAGDVDYTALGVAGAKSIAFDFYAESTTPGALEVYFYNSTSDTEWYYTIAAADLSTGWNTYYVNFWTFEGWYNPDYALGGSQAQLDADLADVDEIGLLLAYQPNLAGQVYRIDDWQIHDEYYIPEPGTCAMLGFLFLSLAITFRKNLNGQVERALAAVRIGAGRHV